MNNKMSDWIPFGKYWSYEVTNIEIDKALRSNERWRELDLLLQSVDLKVGDFVFSFQIIILHIIIL